MASSPHSSENLFSEASQYWDLDRLYADLAAIKQRPLTPTERVCLRGLLCDTNPKEIANALHRQPQGLSVDLTRGLYRYVEAVGNATKISNWREISIVLAHKGYKKQNHLVAVSDRSKAKIQNSKLKIPTMIGETHLMCRYSLGDRINWRSFSSGLWKISAGWLPLSECEALARHGFP